MNSIPQLTWTRVPEGQFAFIDDGSLVVRFRPNGLQFTFTLWHEPHQKLLGDFPTDEEAKAFARTWVGDDEPKGG